jgi:hypothetical protein
MLLALPTSFLHGCDMDELKQCHKQRLEQTIRACSSELQAMEASQALIALRAPMVQAELQKAIKEYSELERTENGSAGN